MTDGYRVDLDHLDDVTARIAGLHGFITDTLTALDARIAAAHQTWEGAAADKHAAAHKEWADSAQTAAEGIAAMRDAAKAAHAAYTDALAANRKTLGV
ncbi:WXG100 family type VII secretion target [Nocardia stercoris]|uniref:ESAT-6-like protein n=1 Tax=Nocardia stercoris TaxID=2483361 RepID=A0A3M2LHI2_9NOCA|nr:WXG100 family type VII secretion target [Nocardia stercoris]RMI34228.1 WXG100 family type VII secretion target [Nocardia stercoris]